MMTMQRNAIFTSHGVDDKRIENKRDITHVSPNKTFALQFDQFAKDVTVHGVNRFGNRDSGWPRRLLWLLVWLVMSALFLRVIIDGMIRYLSCPYTVQVTYENIHNHTFPDVTICNNNIIRKSMFRNDPFAKLFYEELQMITPEGLDNPQLVHWLHSTDVISLFAKAGIPAEEFVSNCHAGSQTTQCPNMTQIITNRGICYSLSGFANSEGQPIISTLSGMEFGFKFNVDVHAHEYSKTRPSDGIGIIVMVHPSGVPPSLNTAFAVAPGTEQYVALQVTQTSRLGLPYSEECRTEKSYSQEKCREECVGELVLNNCGCDIYGGMPSVVNCSVDQFLTCYPPAYEAVYDAEDGGNCSCPLPCEETTFKVVLSNLKYPSDSTVEDITARTGHSKEYLEKNIIEINLYFQSFIAQMVHEEPSYGLAEFAADAGGQMGLFLGASIISISEFLEFLFDLFLIRMNRHKIATADTRK